MWSSGSRPLRRAEDDALSGSGRTGHGRELLASPVSSGPDAAPEDAVFFAQSLPDAPAGPRGPRGYPAPHRRHQRSRRGLLGRQRAVGAGQCLARPVGELLGHRASKVGEKHYLPKPVEARAPLVAQLPLPTQVQLQETGTTSAPVEQRARRLMRPERSSRCVVIPLSSQPRGGRPWRGANEECVPAVRAGFTQ